MSKIVVIGGQKLRGELVVEGSKNAVLPILAAALINGGRSVIRNCPGLKDVEIMIDILRKVGCSVIMEENVVIIDSSTLSSTEIPVELATEMRSSIIFMGPMIARAGKVTITYPGGCEALLAHTKKPMGLYPSVLKILHQIPSVELPSVEKSSIEKSSIEKSSAVKSSDVK